jgi:hypothetical protein
MPKKNESRTEPHALGGGTGQIRTHTKNRYLLMGYQPPDNRAGRSLRQQINRVSIFPICVGDAIGVIRAAAAAPGAVVLIDLADQPVASSAGKVKKR